MKQRLCRYVRKTSAFYTRTAAKAWFLATLLPGLLAPSARAADRQVIHQSPPAATTNSTSLRHLSRWTRLNLSIGLPLRNREGLTNLLQQIYDKNSPDFRHYLTPEQFAERFGPTDEDYQAVTKFARTHGLRITARHSNRMVLGVNGTVADIERAFHVTLNEYQHPTEDRTFFAPSTEPSVDLATPVLSVSGLDNFVVPHPCLKPIPAGQGQPALTGSGPSGAYLGYDFRAAYVPGVTLLGSGQTVGLLEFDSGFYQRDITAYETLAGLPTNVPVTAVLLDGYNGGEGIGNDEVSLDIEMAISMAPGLAGVLVYEGSTTDDILNRMATDNLAKQIGASWTYGIDATSEQIFMQFAAQGQSFYNASGDSDAYTGAVPTPSDDPNITVVGGTTLTTTGPQGAYVSETVWNWGDGVGSSGGISTVYPIPAWQQGISMTANQGSTNMRNLPDVALTADNVYVAYGNGQSGTFGGTSCATPLWAAYTALMNELARTNDEPLVGFLNPTVYAIGKGSNSVPYTNLFHDTTLGNNESPSSPSKFLAVPGYDLCTGWGTPFGENLIEAIALPEPLKITPTTGLLFSGPAGGPFTPATQTFLLTNSAVSNLNWSLTNTSPLFTVYPGSGTLIHGNAPEIITASVAAAATNLSPGSYSAQVVFSNLSDNFGQSRQLTLAVVTPPVITVQPTNIGLLDGMTAVFNVQIASNALMYYQWQKNGANISDGGSVSGTATSTLTITNVSSANAATYSVILSNAAGTLTSSNAVLTIIASAPVIVQQPASQSVLPGAPATFSVAAVGNTPYSYQWEFNGTNLANGTAVSGATNSTLTVSNISTANAGNYTVVVRNSLGSATSSNAVLSITPVTVPGMGMSSLYSFNGTIGDGPYSPLIQGTDGNFYGTGITGGADGDGSVFKMTTNGAVSRVFSFDYDNGAIIYGGLYQGKDGYLYGTAYIGETYGDGALFKMTTTGTLAADTPLDWDNGAYPVCGMTQGSDLNLYGVNYEGGPYGYGTIYRMTTGGVLSTLVAFDGELGAYPSSVLIQGTDGNFYGTCEEGGAYGAGTVFKMSPAGIITNIYAFTGGNDGAIPIPGLVQAADGNFYGTTLEGGANGVGTVFEITSSGEFILRYTFGGTNDGGNPWGGLMQATDGNLYGTTESDGAYGFGTVFQLAPTGGFNTVAQFDGYVGGIPGAALTQGKDGNLYGTTEGGGIYDDGAIYRLNFSGALQITGQPADQEVYSGATAQFTVATFGGGPVSYQWQVNGVNLTNSGNISGVNSNTLTITNVSVGNAAYYSVIVSNSFGSLTSDEAFLEVMFSPPQITSQPTNETVVAGTTATLSVGASGDQPLTYQWKENGVNLTNGGAISGANTSTLTISGVTASNAGIYSVTVSNPLFSISSSNALLTVLPVTSPGTSQTTLHQFGDNISDGAFAYAGLVQGKDSNLYGTTDSGGSGFSGTIFRVSLNGAYTSLFAFTNSPAGANPEAPLMQDTNGYFYGTTEAGGTNLYGIVFRLGSNGVGVSTIYNFDDSTDGATPAAGLLQGADGFLYGTALEGGSNDFGSVYKIGTNGALTSVYGFTGGSDGGYTYSGLVQGKDGSLYGTTLEFGSNGYGTVFQLTTNGALTTLASFGYTNGAFPEAGVIIGRDGNLYGTTYEGGSNGYGTVFSVTTNGQLTTLFEFNSTNGSYPATALTQGTDGNLYGTTSSGGLGGWGTAFRITPGGNLTTLLWFDGLNGADPEGALVQASDGNFYGTTAQGGTNFNPSAGGGNGTVFRLTVPIFITNSISVATATACLPYSSAGIAGFAVAPAGDTLTFAKVSGPAWLNVATNGALSGTPTNANIGTNVFVVSLTDTNGLVATTTLVVPVVPDPPPTFLVNPFSTPWANLDQSYAASIATNATDPEIANGDILTFGKLSGPSWLSVATNGIISGLPEDVNAGSNTFSVIVTNLGGATATATLYVYVNSPPLFSPESFTKPSAIAGIAYAGTIATNAADPDIPAGDKLTFYMVSGPNWLTVATNGALSGTPSSANLGANSFLVLVVDSGDLSAVGSMSISVGAGSPLIWMQNPVVFPGVMAGNAFSASVATNAFDPNSGGVPVFSKVSGPAWLTVGANGAISGTPLSANVGTNLFTVSVTDGTGLSSNTVVSVNVTPAPPIVLKIAPQGTNLVLSWSGGIAPYQVMTAVGLNPGPWTNASAAIMGSNMIIVPSNSSAFYQVHGQ